MKAMTITAICAALSLTLVNTRAVNAQQGGVTVATGLNSPMGVLLGSDGSLWAVDSGIGGETEVKIMNRETGKEEIARVGNSARVVKFAADGSSEVMATLPSVLLPSGETSGGARLAVMNGSVWVTSGAWDANLDKIVGKRMPRMAAILKIENNQANEVASTWDLENGSNPDGTEIDTHPYGLAVGPDGMLWIADAGGNDLLKLDPSTGKFSVVVSFDGIPSPIPNPARAGRMETDPVPTEVVFDKAGNALVSLLPGVPFLPGSSKVLMVSKAGKVSDYATGLSSTTDIRFGPDGQLYGVQFAQFTKDGPMPNSGALVRIKPGANSEVVIAGLSFPTSVDFNSSGDAFVAINGVGAPGSGSIVRYNKIAAKP